ncbi:HDOD domain-containing protein [Gemmatimonadota bacterium]
MYTLAELIEQLLNVRKLPTISNVALMLEQSLNQEEPDVENVSEIISNDPAVTGQVLKVANSALYGARRTIGTVQEAVMRLGFQEVRKMVMALALIDFLSEARLGLMNPLEFMRHSIGVAAGMQVVNKMTGLLRQDGNKAHVIGLLHDLGRWVSANYMPDVHQQILADDDDGDMKKDIIILEREHIGLDHTQIGAAVLERWGLPLPIVQGVRFHHDPEVSSDTQRKMARVIYLVDNICISNEIGEVGEGPGGDIKESLWKKVGLDPEAEEEIVSQINETLKQSQVLLSIGGYEN